MTPALFSGLLSTIAFGQTVEYGGCTDPQTGIDIPSIYQNIPDIALATRDSFGRPLIYGNYSAITSGEYPKLFLKFTYAHECAHHTLRHLDFGITSGIESEADCEAARNMSQRGVLRSDNFDILAEAMRTYLSEDAAHPSPESRIENILQYCVNFSINESVLGVMPGYSSNVSPYDTTYLPAPELVVALPKPHRNDTVAVTVLTVAEQFNPRLEKLDRAKFSEVSADPDAYFNQLEKYFLEEPRKLCADDFYLCDNEGSISFDLYYLIRQYIRHNQFERGKIFLEETLMPQKPYLAHLALSELYIARHATEPTNDELQKLVIKHFNKALLENPNSILPFVSLLDQYSHFKPEILIPFYLTSGNYFERIISKKSVGKYSPAEHILIEYNNTMIMLAEMSIDGHADRTLVASAIKRYFKFELEQKFTLPTENRDYLHLLIGLMALLDNDQATAFFHIKNAQELDPTDPDNTLGFSIYYAHKGDIMRASAYLKKAIQLYDANPKSRRLVHDFPFEKFPTFEKLNNLPDTSEAFSKLKAY